MTDMLYSVQFSQHIGSFEKYVNKEQSERQKKTNMISPKKEKN